MHIIIYTQNNFRINTGFEAIFRLFEYILYNFRDTNAGRIKEIITKGGISTSYTYDEDGNISRLTIGDGTAEGLLYDAFMLYDLNCKRTGYRLDGWGCITSIGSCIRSCKSCKH